MEVAKRVCNKVDINSCDAGGKELEGAPAGEAVPGRGAPVAVCCAEETMGDGFC